MGRNIFHHYKSSLKSSSIDTIPISGVSLSQFKSRDTNKRPGLTHCKKKFNLANKEQQHLSSHTVTKSIISEIKLSA